jgi:hypothetical protein
MMYMQYVCIGGGGRSARKEKIVVSDYFCSVFRSYRRSSGSKFNFFLCAASGVRTTITIKYRPNFILIETVIRICS